MKISTHSFLAIAYTFLILNAFVLSSKSKITVSRSRNSKRLHNTMHSRKNNQPSNDEIICDKHSERMDPNLFDIIEFLVTMINRVAYSFTADVAGTIQKMIKPANLLDDKCKAMLEREYVDEIAKIEGEVYERSKMTVSNKIKIEQDLGLNLSEKTILEKNINNPMGLCKANVEILKTKINDAEKWKRRAEKLTKLIDESIEQNHSLKDLETRSHDFFKSEKKTVLYEWIQNKIDPKNPPKDLRPLLIEAKEELAESNMQASLNHMEAMALQEIKCDNLPTDLKDNEKDTCIKVSFATKALAAIKLFSIKNIGICLASLGADKILRMVAGYGLDKVLSVLLNVVGLFVYGLVKIVYYAVKIIYYLYSAHSEKNMRKKSTHYGNAVGTAIKVVLSVIQVDMKRRFK